MFGKLLLVVLLDRWNCLSFATYIKGQNLFLHNYSVIVCLLMFHNFDNHERKCLANKP